MSPPVTDGLARHYDASELTLVDSDPVSTWPNLGSQGSSWDVAASGDARPLFDADTDAVVFDGSNDRLVRVGISADAIAQPNTVFVVAQSATTSGDRHVFDGDGSSSNRHFLRLSGGDWLAFAGPPGITVSPADTDLHIFGALFNGASSWLRVDGAQTAGEVTASRSHQGQSIGGQHGGGNHWQGSVHEVLFYSRALTAQEVSDTEDYLTAKWFGGGGTVQVGRVTEHDTARAFTTTQTVAVGRATETGQARAFAPSHTVTVGRATEHDRARTFTATHSTVVGRAAEHDVARGFTVLQPGAVDVGRVSEHDAARSFQAVHTVALQRAAEHDTARAFTALHRLTVGRVTEHDTARAWMASQREIVALGRVVETDTARPFVVPTDLTFPLALFTDFTRPTRFDESDPRPQRFDDADPRPARWLDTERPARWQEHTRPRLFGETQRPTRFDDTQRPQHHHETIFYREDDMPLELETVEVGPYSENERPESLFIRVLETLRDGTTQPLELFGQTPEWTAQVSITDPADSTTTRSATIPDPADLPTDDPDNFDSAEEGWVRVDWATSDFADAGEYQVQITLDNTDAGGGLTLKSQTVYKPQVKAGPASAVVGS